MSRVIELNQENEFFSCSSYARWTKLVDRLDAGWVFCNPVIVI